MLLEVGGRRSEVGTWRRIPTRVKQIMRRVKHRLTELPTIHFSPQSIFKPKTVDARHSWLVSFLQENGCPEPSRGHHGVSRCRDKFQKIKLDSPPQCSIVITLSAKTGYQFAASDDEWL